MPPKKKPRTTGNLKSDSSAAMTLDDVSPLQIKLKDWIVKAYSLRHGCETEKFPWPVDNGGSLLEICRRCWDSGSLIKDSLALLQKMGIMSDSTTVHDFEDKFMKSKDGFEFFSALNHFATKFNHHFTVCSPQGVESTKIIEASCRLVNPTWLFRNFRQRRGMFCPPAFCSGIWMMTHFGEHLQWLPYMTLPRASRSHLGGRPEE